MMRRILLVTLALTTAVTTACSSDESSQGGSLPDGKQLLTDSAEAMSDVRSAHFTLDVNGEIPGLPVHKADGDLTREGDDAGAAKGTISIDLMGSLFEGDFVLVDNTLYFRGPTGSNWQEVPASLVTSTYDPGAILDPDRGVAKVRASVQNAKTEGTEDIDGVSTYRVTGRVTRDVVSDLVPGVDSDVDVTFWVLEDGDHEPVKASVKVTERTGVDVTVSDLDKQVSITAPE
jgi:lipoprotein LprG